MDTPITRVGRANATARPALFLTAPHSGEWLPPEADWLSGINPQVLLTDVDRFVDLLYAPAQEALDLPFITTRVHRYAADLNRLPEDVDLDSVEGSTHPSGTFTKGFHWVATTRGEKLMTKPLSVEQHRDLVKKYHDPFHAEISKVIRELRSEQNDKTIYHLDLHSMPSRGTAAHTDAGKMRAQVVVSDCDGTSASPAFKIVVLNALREQGLDVAYNDPYKGGRITQRYGKPVLGHETIQIELNRALYLNEQTFERGPGFATLSKALTQAIQTIQAGL